MSNREATSTIKGYLYQFDLTILKILQLSNPDDFVEVEGVEDVDVSTLANKVAVQCKYHSETEYNHSVIGEPIRLMLNHFAQSISDTGVRMKYLFYGHFKSGQEKLAVPINLDFLKNTLLTYKKSKIEHKHYEELKLTDSQLNEFLCQLEIDINAPEYNLQLTGIFKTLMKELRCDEFDAENYFYCNALRVVSSLAKEKDIRSRRITKSDFLKRIDQQQILFDKWFLMYKSKNKLLKDLRNKYFSKLNISPFERFFLFEVEPDSEFSEIIDVINEISKKWTNVKSRKDPDTFCAYVFMKDAPLDLQVRIKKALTDQGLNIKDGFDYFGAEFNVDSISEQATYHNQIHIKLLDRVEFLEAVLKMKSKRRKGKEVYQFFKVQPYFKIEDDSVKHVKIQIQELIDIKEII